MDCYPSISVQSGVSLSLEYPKLGAFCLAERKGVFDIWQYAIPHHFSFSSIAGQFVRLVRKRILLLVRQFFVFQQKVVTSRKLHSFSDTCCLFCEQLLEPMVHFIRPRLTMGEIARRLHFPNLSNLMKTNELRVANSCFYVDQKLLYIVVVKRLRRQPVLSLTIFIFQTTKTGRPTFAFVLYKHRS